MKKQSEYPKFVSNQPCCKDMYVGKSQERLAKTLAEHIKKGESNSRKKQENENNIPHIIGLEGSWGSGKSNLIGILKKKYLKDTHFIYEYNAWGHQEDLKRRAFLESLTNELIEEEILPKKTKAIRDDNQIEITWLQKLEDLLARKRKTNIKTNPRLSFAIIISIIILIITPITTGIAGEVKGSNFWIYTLYLTPIILILISIIYLTFSNKKWSELFVVYSGEKIKDVIYETISENEPSITEFNHWMSDLSYDLKKKKLIIVFDNMDRLPATKVKELWSSIHTFFAEVSYKNIWVIIPFDKNHLANAFGNSELDSDDKEAQKLTTHFINKTFPITYHIAAPIISDLKSVFRDYFELAFGKETYTRKDIDTIRRIFGITNTNPTIRDVITFINDLVLQRMTWHEEISLLHIAIFNSQKNKIINDESSIAENILNDNYLDNIQKLVDDKQELQESIFLISD